MQIDALAVAAGETCLTVGQAWTAELRGDTDSVAAFLLGGVAAVSSSAGKFERLATNARVLVALAGWTAGRAAATVVFLGAACSVAQKLPFGTGLRGSAVQTGGGRTSQNGSPEEALEYVATRKLSGQRTRQCVETPVVHLLALLTEHILRLEGPPGPLQSGPVEGAYSP